MPRNIKLIFISLITSLCALKKEDWKLLFGQFRSSNLWNSQKCSLLIGWENTFQSILLEQTNLMFLRDSYLQKTKDIFLTPEDNLHKPCIFEISIKLWVYVEPKRIRTIPIDKEIYRKSIKISLRNTLETSWKYLIRRNINSNFFYCNYEWSCNYIF